MKPGGMKMAVGVASALAFGTGGSVVGAVGAVVGVVDGSGGDSAGGSGDGGWAGGGSGGLAGGVFSASGVLLWSSSWFSIAKCASQLVK